MGFDEENLEPKQRRTKNSIQRRYLIEHDDLKREVKANTYQELLDEIKSLLIYNGEKTKIEYWSNVYNDWLLLESLPDNESRIKISPCIQNKEPEMNLSNLIEFEARKILEDSSLLTDGLNTAFKKYVETEDSEFFRYFEVAVIFACKRREQKFDIEDFVLRSSEQQQILKSLNDEMKKFQSSNKQFKVQLENLSQKLNSLEINSAKNKKSNRKNNKCIII